MAEAACWPTAQHLTRLMVMCVHVMQAPAPDAMLPIATHRAAPAGFRLGMHEVSAATQVSRILHLKADLLSDLRSYMFRPRP